jgi:hypothetical protein
MPTPGRGSSSSSPTKSATRRASTPDQRLHPCVAGASSPGASNIHPSPSEIGCNSASIAAAPMAPAQA